MPQEAVIQLYDECRVIKVLTCSIHDAVERFEIEKRVYERISPHPRVIGYHGMRSGIGHAGGIVLDIAINGSVADYLAEHPNTPGDIRYRWCLEITDALVHLHSNGVIWSDGNPANVLLDAELNSVISDFGGSSIDGSLATAFGPPGYSRLGGTGASPSFHADIFSFGSIIFYILSGSHPYDLGMFGEGFPPLPTNIGSAFARIIQKCWSVDYEATSQLRADVQGAMFATEQSLSSILDRPPRLSYQLLVFAPDDCRPHTLSATQCWHTFRWRDMNPNAVSVHIVAINHRSDVVFTTDALLERTWSGFEVTVALPWSAKICYRFHVDGQWLALAAQEREVDQFGLDNNLYWTPHKMLDQHDPLGLVKQPTVDGCSASAHSGLCGIKSYAAPMSFLAIVLLGAAVVLGGQYMV